ncbi:DUF58 domain-containing protein [Halovivax cerinus]|uniref:DUF58 domain-containing protein n=1 Tax=Halovivax cerinus TaxID=1487865 RepID=A0ABD5NU88_9EURY|nr:DUF58 domain-containing protein [Halovivax cerinus]
MRPTVRGVVALGVIGVCVVIALNGGRAALNAIVAPLVVVTVAAVGIVAASSRPTVRRRPVTPGYVGETRTVSFELDATRGTVVTATDSVGTGLYAAERRLERVLSGRTTLSYEVSLRSRGVRTVGPLTVTVQDPLGLVVTRYRYEATEPVFVYPPVYELTSSARATLEGFATDASAFDRSIFEHLREYERGDSLRDVHWKSAAKRPDGELVVKEFVADDGLDRLTMVGACDGGDPDELAAAVATLVDHLFELDVGVSLTLPGEPELDAMPSARADVFVALTRLDTGPVAPEAIEAADVVVDADEDGVSVTLGERTVPFADLCVVASDDGAGATTDSSVSPPGSTTGPARVVSG